MKRPKRISKLTTPRRVYVPRMDPGDGKKLDVWVELSATGITVRKFGSCKSGWFVPLRAAAEAIARAGQLREIRLTMGRPLEAEGEHGPLFGG